MTNQKDYSKYFQITENIGNNVFCSDKIKNPTIYIPNIITVNLEEFKKNIDKYLKIGRHTVFREYKNGKIVKYKGLMNFIKLEDKNKTIYIIDNHNHALYFWYEEFFQGNISKGAKLIHIDQHTDMNDNEYNLSISSVEKEDRCGIVFDFTNKKCNVGNFIKPAVEEGLIGNITQINTEYSLLKHNISLLSFEERGIGGEVKKRGSSSEILDIDLDFRAPEMSIEKYKKTIDITQKLIRNSGVVTIATSPYFFDQKLAIKIIKDLIN